MMEVDGAALARPHEEDRPIEPTMAAEVKFFGRDKGGAFATGSLITARY